MSLGIYILIASFLFLIFLFPSLSLRTPSWKPHFHLLRIHRILENLASNRMQRYVQCMHLLVLTKISNIIFYLSHMNYPSYLYLTNILPKILSPQVLKKSFASYIVLSFTHSLYNFCFILQHSRQFLSFFFSYIQYNILHFTFKFTFPIPS